MRNPKGRGVHLNDLNVSAAAAVQQKGSCRLCACHVPVLFGGSSPFELQSGARSVHEAQTSNEAQ
jgi:hypothetical protein